MSDMLNMSHQSKSNEQKHVTSLSSFGKLMLLTFKSKGSMEKYNAWLKIYSVLNVPHIVPNLKT